MKPNYLLLLMVFVIGIASCKRSSPVEEKVEQDRKSQPCGKTVEAYATNFTTVSSDVFTIADASISGDCLTLKLGLATGCADPASLSVLHATSAATVYPQQHALKIALRYGTGCTTPELRTYSFDLYPIRQKNTNKILIGISGQQGYYKTLEYSY